MLGVSGGEVYDPSPLTLVSVTDGAAGFVQVESLGPYRRQVIDPVGWSPPVSVATSLIAPPTATDAGEALVVRPGAIGVTVTVSLSAEQRPLTAALLASPLYLATHW